MVTSTHLPVYVAFVLLFLSCPYLVAQEAHAQSSVFTVAASPCSRCLSPLHVAWIHHSVSAVKRLLLDSQIM